MKNDQRDKKISSENYQTQFYVTAFFYIFIHLCYNTHEYITFNNSDCISCQTTSSYRINWIDIFKAICIILMVLGHAYGGFNNIIYQFHMAAFFFISGYSSNIWKRDLEKTTFKKLHTLILPIFVMIIFLSFISHIIDSQGLYNSIAMLWDDEINFIIWGAVVNLLGAVWFLLALFFCFVIHRMLFIFCSNHKYHLLLYFVATIITFLFGYYLNGRGFINPHFFDVALVAQLYFGIGVCVRLMNKPEFKINVIGILFIGLFCVVIMYVLGKSGFPVTMDMVSRKYPSQIVMLTVPFVGIIATFCFSVLIDSCLHYVKNLMLFIGKETLGILFLHFASFKVATVMLMIVGITTFNDLKAFLLPQQLQNIPWAIIFYIVVAITVSIIIWKAMRSIPYLKVLLGKSCDENEDVI